MCGPRGLRGAPDHLFRNNGDGTFTDTTQQAGVADDKGLYGFGVAWFDLDDDGRLDLLVANDSGPNYVYRNRRRRPVRGHQLRVRRGARRQRPRAGAHGRGHRRLRQRRTRRHPHHELRRRLQRALPQPRRRQRDRRQLPRRASRRCRFRSSAGARTFSTTTTTAGWICSSSTATSIRRRTRCRGTPPTRSARSCSATWQGRRFEEIGAAAGEGLTTPRVSRGSAVGDFDNDGGVDVVINNLDGAPTLARNVGGGAAGHWLTVRLSAIPAANARATRSARWCSSRPAACGGAAKSPAGAARSRSRICACTSGSARETTVSKLEVRWAGGDAASYAIDRVDTLVTIDQKSGRVISTGR